MKHTLFVIIAFLALIMPDQSTCAQETLYFPNDNESWQRIAPASVGWNESKIDAALQVASDRNTSGLMILHNGRIIAERYWELEKPPLMYRAVRRGSDKAGHPIEDVASAQKSIVAVLVGIAQEKGFLSIEDQVVKYLGAGWSKATPEQENAITIRHLISMSSGLTTGLEYEAEPGVKWRYNTPAYHLLMDLLCVATGKERNPLTTQWLTEPLGMSNSSWVRRRGKGTKAFYGFTTTARDLARFGMMVQANGRWNDKQIIRDQGYLEHMLTPSQDSNRAYGYLWWLNEHENTTSGLAGRRRSRGRLIPNAPKDLVAMQGALDRKLYLVPSLNLIVVRLGAQGQTKGVNFNKAFWNALIQAAPK